MVPVYCETCGTTLRQTPGIHRANEPFLETDEIGPLIRCPKCGGVNRSLSPNRLAEKPEAAKGAPGC